MVTQADALKSTALTLVGAALKTLVCTSEASGRKNVYTYFVFPHLVRDPDERRLMLDTYEQAFEEVLSLMIDRAGLAQAAKPLHEAIPRVLNMAKAFLDEVYRGDSVATPYLLSSPEDYDNHRGGTHVVQIQFNLHIEYAFSAFAIKRRLMAFDGVNFNEVPLKWPGIDYPDV